VRRPPIWAEAGGSLDEVYVPQADEPGAAQAEVDFGDLWVVYRGIKTKSILELVRELVWG
jgi:hypothetical protein